MIRVRKRHDLWVVTLPGNYVWKFHTWERAMEVAAEAAAARRAA